MSTRRGITATLVVGLLAAAAGVAAAQLSYEQATEQWRRSLDAELRADDGWLTVAGLFWLKEGPNRVGSDPSNDVALPKGSAPARVGVFRLRDGRTVFEAEPGVAVRVNGAAAATAALRPDVDRVVVGDLTMIVIKRGTRYGIRLRDKNTAARRTFAGRVWFPVNPAYRVTGRFVAYSSPKEIPIVNVLGDPAPMSSPGYVEFTLGGKTVRLDPVAEPGSRQLFFIFKDLTAGSATYPAGRFLYADLPSDGVIELDFNRAINPPCAFTPYATCPLPPGQNELPVSIEAGERYAPHK